MTDKKRKERKETSIPQYAGKAGQLAFMAELCHRGYNTAMPEIDIGDDVFAVNHLTNEMWRIQVKTSKARNSEARNPRTISFQFNVKPEAIDVKTKTTFISFVMRFNENWIFCLLSVEQIRTYIELDVFGSLSHGKYVIYLSWDLNKNKLTTGAGNKKTDLTKYLTEWHARFPVIS